MTMPREGVPLINYFDRAKTTMKAKNPQQGNMDIF